MGGNSTSSLTMCHSPSCLIFAEYGAQWKLAIKQNNFNIYCKIKVPQMPMFMWICVLQRSIIYLAGTHGTDDSSGVFRETCIIMNCSATSKKLFDTYCHPLMLPQATPRNNHLSMIKSNS